MKRWAKLTNQQLQGADYALRVLHTSPRVRGAALGLLEDLIREILAESKSRSAGAGEE